MLGGLLAHLGFATPVARAGTLRGQITLAPDRGEKAPEGLWRIDNGILAVQPRALDPHGECAVLLFPKTPPHDKELSKENITAELRGLKLTPQVIVVPLGAQLTIKNEDRVPYALRVVGPDEAAFPSKALAAGASRQEVLQHPGIYPLRDDEQAHLRGFVIVTEGAISMRPDEHWAFHGEVPDGHYDLKIFYRGAYVVERSLDIGSKSTEIQLLIPARKPHRDAAAAETH